MRTRPTRVPVAGSGAEDPLAAPSASAASEGSATMMP